MSPWRAKFVRRGFLAAAEEEIGVTEDVMNRDMLDDAFHVAARIAADRNIDIDRDALVRALRVVTGECDGQDDPTEIAEDALELLGNTMGFPASRRS